MCLIILFLPFQRLKAFVGFQLFIEKLGGEAKHTFFRYLAAHILHSFVYSKVLNSTEPVNNVIILLDPTSRRIMKTSQHAGVQSVVLTNIKNQVEQSSKVRCRSFLMIQS